MQGPVPLGRGGRTQAQACQRSRRSDFPDIVLDIVRGVLQLEVCALTALTPQRRHRHRGDPFAAADRAEAFVRRRLDVDALRRYAEAIGDRPLHLGDARRQLRALGDDRRIDVVDGEAALTQQAERFVRQGQAGGVLPLRVVRWKVGADVAGAGGAQQRVDDRVQQDVGVGVAGQPGLALKRDAAEDERPPGLEAVDVVADADSHALGVKGQGSRVKVRYASSAGVKAFPLQQALPPTLKKKGPPFTLSLDDRRAAPRSPGTLRPSSGRPAS